MAALGAHVPRRIHNCCAHKGHVEAIAIHPAKPSARGKRGGIECKDDFQCACGERGGIRGGAAAIGEGTCRFQRGARGKWHRGEERGAKVIHGGGGKRGAADGQGHSGGI